MAVVRVDLGKRWLDIPEKEQKISNSGEVMVPDKYACCRCLLVQETICLFKNVFLYSFNLSFLYISQLSFVRISYLSINFNRFKSQIPSRKIKHQVDERSLFSNQSKMTRYLRVLRCRFYLTASIAIDLVDNQLGFTFFRPV